MAQYLWKTVPQKFSNTVTIGSHNSTPWYIPKTNETICLHKNLYVNVYSSIIHTAKSRINLNAQQLITGEPRSNVSIQLNIILELKGVKY